MAHSEAFNAVARVITQYFDGLYASDVPLLEQVFHPKAQYVCATDSPVLHRLMPGYFEIVAKRESPASRGEARADRILSIEFAGANMAFAKVECAIAEKFFTDFLTLVKADGRWQIISKVFHYDLCEVAHG